jgi:purine-binding chemotaxis protein CheW
MRAQADVSEVVLSPNQPKLWLVCRVGTRLCALSLIDVVETMRPLPVEPVAGAPEFVRGVSIIRGSSMPLVDAAHLLGAEGATARRFVTLRSQGGMVALAVDEVLGVRVLPLDALRASPPLLSEARAGVVRALGTLDQQLLVVLEAARLVPESVWESIRTARQSS